MNHRKTAEPFGRERDALCWGDTRSPEAESRRACVFTFPADSTIKDFQRFFGIETLEGISIMRKNVKKPIAFIQFKRPNDYTTALLKNQEKFLNTNYKITIRPYSKRDIHPRGRERALMLENSPIRDTRSRSRSRDRIRDRDRWHSRSSDGGNYSRSSRIDRGYDRLNHRNHTRSTDRSQDRTPSDRSSPVMASQIIDNWGRNLTFPGHGSFNRYDDPDLRGELPSKASALQSQGIANLPPNSHSFGSLTQRATFPSSIAPSQNLDTASISTDYTPNYTGQAAKPLTELPPIGPSVMPRPIELLLHLVVETKTARTLAPGQIQDILNYFKAEKEAVESILTYNQTKSLQNPSTEHQEIETNEHEINGYTHPSDSRSRNEDDSAAPVAGPEITSVISKFLTIGKSK